MSVTAGDIYYTKNGKEIVAYQNAAAESYDLINAASDKSVHVPTDDIGTLWLSDYNYDDSDWTIVTGLPGGIGYENGNGYQQMISLDVADAMSQNPGCYLRLKFRLDSVQIDSLATLSLRVLYDDGFVAYLNGVRVASANAPDQPYWRSPATAGHEADDFVAFDISSYLLQLHEGDNLLAIHALDTGTNSSDFIINAELSGKNASAIGDVSEEAILYQGPIILNNSRQIIARSLLAGEWSAKKEIFFSVPTEIFDLTVSEIHYHPSLTDTTEDDRDYEFIELKNRGQGTLDLNGLIFSNGISYKFSAGSFINPNDFLVLASDKASFFKRYGFMPYDVFEGNLSNGGEGIVLETSLQDTIFNISYNDAFPWPESADGNGFSLVQLYPDSNLNINDAANWGPSINIHGSPGMYEPLVSAIAKTETAEPSEYQLIQNFPNPFNPITVIRYSIGKERVTGHSEGHHVELAVFNILGQKVATLVNRKQKAGQYSVQWDASGNSSGIYFYRLQTNEYSGIKKMIFLK